MTGAWAHGGGLMVCGTGSDVGKSQVVGGLCRLLARRKVSVAPFKAQNMALNSYVTPSGHEIGRAQGIQALAAGAVPEVAMNPILLKPTGERTCQVVLHGEPLGHLSATAYHELKPTLLHAVLEALADLRRRFDVVVLEGAGSPAEINLLAHDIVNLRVAKEANLPAIVVGDIDRGGVFAALYGTVALLPRAYRALVRGFVINKFRGDPALIEDGLAELEHRCGVPTLGVLPFVHDVALDAEDSLALAGPRPRPLAGAGATSEDAPVGVRSDTLDIAAVRFPRISNFTDLDALGIEPGLSVRMVEDAAGIGDPDLVVLPGTKATVSDLCWLRGRSLDRAIARCRERGTTVLGICGGYQMLGRRVVDEVESGRGEVGGLGWLDVETIFSERKLTRQRRGVAVSTTGGGTRVSGYEVRHGRTTRGSGTAAWMRLDDAYGEEDEGALSPGDGSPGDGSPGDGSVRGTSLHGLFEEDGFRASFLCDVAARRNKQFVPAGVSFSAARTRQLDRFADLLEAHLDLGAIEKLVTSGVARDPVPL